MMRVPLLSSILVLAIVATVPLVPAVCISRHEKSESKGEEVATAAEEHGGSIKPLSLDGYGPLEKAAKKPKEQILDVQATPAMIPDTYDQKPIEEKGETAMASAADEQPDKYVESLVPEKVKEDVPAEVKEKSDESDESAYSKKVKKAKKEKKEKSDDEQPDKYVESLVPEKVKEEEPADVKKEKSDESDEAAYSKKVKKAKKEKKEKSDDDSDEKEKEKSDYLDESTSSKKEKREKSDDSDASSYSKKKKKAKIDDSDEDTSSKKEKKEKSISGKKQKKDTSDDSDNTSPKKQKKEKSIDSDASAYFKKEEKESDEATSLKKQKEKKKKEKSGDYFAKEDKEKSEEDATPVDVDDIYVSPKEEKSDGDAKPVDISTTTGQYISSSKADGKPKGGERQRSTATADAYASPKQQVASSQPIAGGAPDELPPVAKRSATFDAYTSSKQQVASSQPIASDAPDELPPVAKSSGGTPDQYAPLKVAAAGQPNEPAAAKPPKLSMETFSGMIRRPIAKFLSPVIKSVCAKTEYPEDCESSIGGLPGAASAAATDSVGVLKLAMEAVRQKAIEAMNAATDRMNAPGTDPTTKEALDSCTSSYSDIKTSLDTVDDALKRGDVDTAHTNLDSVETDVTTCDDGFQERGTPSVMTDHDQELQKLASNLLSIGAAIHH